MIDSLGSCEISYNMKSHHNFTTMQTDHSMTQGLLRKCTKYHLYTDNKPTLLYKEPKDDNHNNMTKKIKYDDWGRWAIQILLLLYRNFSFPVKAANFSSWVIPGYNKSHKKNLPVLLEQEFLQTKPTSESTERKQEHEWNGESLGSQKRNICIKRQWHQHKTVQHSAH